MDSTNGGTKQPSDSHGCLWKSSITKDIFSFVGSSSGSYEVTSNSIHHYSASYSPAGSGTARSANQAYHNQRILW